MSSRGDICTPILETYFAPVLSTLPTTEVNDGRPLAPGGGWVMSAPDEQIRCEPSYVQKVENLTHYHSWVYGICEEGYVVWICYGVSPAEFHVDSE